MKWHILDTGIASAEANMALDAELLQKISKTEQPILHLYGWEGDCATYGYFLDPYKILKKESVKRYNLQLARRPTGGGLVFHLTDLAFSILVPARHSAYSVNTLENYAFVNRIVANVVQQFLGTKEHPDLLSLETKGIENHSRHFCMAKPTKYDVMWQGRKVGGAAQRRTRHGFLHQGTISIALPSKSFLLEILTDPTVFVRMQENTFSLLKEEQIPEELAETRRFLQELLMRAVQGLEEN